jgi:hypothetical protein
MCKRSGYSSTPILSVLSNPERLPCIGSIHILPVSAWRGARVFPQLPIQSLCNRRILCRVPRNYSEDLALTGGLLNILLNRTCWHSAKITSSHCTEESGAAAEQLDANGDYGIVEIWSCSVERDLESPARTRRSWRRSCTVLPDFFAQASCRELRCQYPFTAPALVMLRKLHKC